LLTVGRLMIDTGDTKMHVLQSIYKCI